MADTTDQAGEGTTVISLAEYEALKAAEAERDALLLDRAERDALRSDMALIRRLSGNVVDRAAVRLEERRSG